MIGVASSAAFPHLPGTVTMLDLIIIVFVLLSMAVGFWTGLVWQFVRIAGLVGSIWVSWLYYPAIADYLGDSVPLEIRQVLAAAVAFAGALTLCYLLAYLFRGLINALRPQMPDRVLGAVFGMFRGVLVVGFVALLAIRFLAPENPVRETVQGSRGAVAAATCVRTFLYVLPERLARDPSLDDAGAKAGSQALRPALVPPRGEPREES
jgi:membrane protein required for colicin V production